MSSTTSRPHALHWPTIHATRAVIRFLTPGAQFVARTVRKHWRMAISVAAPSFVLIVVMALAAQEYARISWEKSHAYSQEIADLRAGDWGIQE